MAAATAFFPGHRHLLLTGPGEHGNGIGGIDRTLGGERVAKSEWGKKLQCHNCGARFYDLGRDPATCPICNTVYEPDRHPKSRRVAVVKEREPAPAEVEQQPPDAKADAVTENAEDAAAPDDEEAPLEEGIAGDQDGLIEDASDLGEDDDDVSEVMEHIDEDVEDKP